MGETSLRNEAIERLGHGKRDSKCIEARHRDARGTSQGSYAHKVMTNKYPGGGDNKWIEFLKDPREEMGVSTER